VTHVVQHPLDDIGRFGARQPKLAVDDVGEVGARQRAAQSRFVHPSDPQIGHHCLLKHDGFPPPLKSFRN